MLIGSNSWKIVTEVPKISYIKEASGKRMKLFDRYRFFLKVASLKIRLCSLISKLGHVFRILNEAVQLKCLELLDWFVDEGWSLL